MINPSEARDPLQGTATTWRDEAQYLCAILIAEGADTDTVKRLVEASVYHGALTMRETGSERA